MRIEHQEQQQQQHQQQQHQYNATQPAFVNTASLVSLKRVQMLQTSSQCSQVNKCHPTMAANESSLP